MTKNPLPRLITFDGEARSGKGTVVQLTKDYLRDERGHKVMLIDAGQVFRVLVVAAMRANIDLDDPGAIDAYLASDENSQKAVQLVKDVYHMDKEQRDGLLYTNLVGENSAKIGARPASQTFKDELLKKWLHDARDEGFDTVLLDGRALEETGTMLENEKLCNFVLGLYFICDPIMGALRTLGFAGTEYADLASDDRAAVDELVAQIIERNQRDRERAVQPIVPPSGVPISRLPQILHGNSGSRPMYIIDTSSSMTKQEMSMPVAEMVAGVITK